MLEDQEKEKNKDLMPVLSIIATLLPTVGAFGASSTGLRIITIVLYILIVIMVYNYQHKKTELKKNIIIAASVFEIAIVINSIFDLGITEYLGRIKSFVFAENKINVDETLENSIDEIENKITELNREVKEINKNIYSIDGYINYMQLNRNINRDEVDEIVLKIKEIASERDIYDFKTDKYFVELYYKMSLSHYSWYYSNILKAFEEYGIEVDKLGIDEHVLLTWDIHMLCNMINMKEKNLPNLKSDDVVEDTYYQFNDNRMNTEKYSDDLDYGSWSKPYRDMTGAEINESLNFAIENMCEKIMMNFSDN